MLTKHPFRGLIQIRVSQKNHDKLVEIAADMQKQQQGKKKIVSLDEALSFVIEKYEASKK